MRLFRTLLAPVSLATVLSLISVAVFAAPECRIERSETGSTATSPVTTTLFTMPAFTPSPVNLGDGIVHVDQSTLKVQTALVYINIEAFEAGFEEISVIISDRSGPYITSTEAGWDGVANLALPLGAQGVALTVRCRELDKGICKGPNPTVCNWP